MVPRNGDFIPVALINQLFTLVCANRGLDVKVLRIASKRAFRLGSNRPVAATHPAGIKTRGAVTERVVCRDGPAFIVSMPGAHAVTRHFNLTGIVDDAVMRLAGLKITFDPAVTEPGLRLLVLGQRILIFRLWLVIDVNTGRAPAA